jgi:hypothetical protein
MPSRSAARPSRDKASNPVLLAASLTVLLLVALMPRPLPEPRPYPAMAVQVAVDVEPSGTWLLTSVLTGPGSPLLEQLGLHLGRPIMSHPFSDDPDAVISRGVTARRAFGWASATLTGTTAPVGFPVLEPVGQLRRWDVLVPVGGDEVVVYRDGVPGARVGLADLGGVLVGPEVPATANPPEVTTATEFLGGSEGLLLALAYLDVLTGGQLTGGRTVAVTGVLDLDDAGRVVLADGVAYVPTKLEGAARSGATVFIIPASAYDTDRFRLDEASQRLGVELVVVSTVEDALRWLCRTGGTSPVCPG